MDPGRPRHRHRPLAERPGWQRVTALATTGTLAAVITLNRPMIGHGPRD
ncbi:hypothetical protein [Kitasatospora indigofera]